MNDKKSLLSSGWGMVGRNKRYIFWFWLLNLTLAEFGTAAFRKSAHAILDHSVAADRLLHGFDISVMINLFTRPEFGQMSAMTTPATYFAFLFFLATALFLPGVFQGYASTYRLPREDFFRACGRNLWRFIRLMIIAGIVMGIIAGVLFGISGALVKKAGESTNEVLPFEMHMAGLAVIFLVMTTVRIWFDLAEADVVLSDQRAVRKSIGAAFRHTFRSLGRLLASYVVTTIAAAIILVGGIWAWMKLVAPEKWFGAFLLSQVILLLLLVPRFWQRGVAVSYWKQNMMAPVVVVPPIMPQPIVPQPIPPPQPVPVAVAPEPAPVAPDPPPEAEGI
ncbi:MAG TPA: hypothetical protein VKF84_04605 [Candidatus Sulfotelmatobacter sp.]|nr:hypothetical protein [Candidatus Sulfotelmatobacter sp.]